MFFTVGSTGYDSSVCVCVSFPSSEGFAVRSRSSEFLEMPSWTPDGCESRHGTPWLTTKNEQNTLVWQLRVLARHMDPMDPTILKGQIALTWFDRPMTIGTQGPSHWMSLAFFLEAKCVFSCLFIQRSPRTLHATLWLQD